MCVERELEEELADWVAVRGADWAVWNDDAELESQLFLLESIVGDGARAWGIATAAAAIPLLVNIALPGPVVESVSRAAQTLFSPKKS